MKKAYEAPSINVTKFSVEDIITASGSLPTEQTHDFGEVTINVTELIDF